MSNKNIEPIVPKIEPSDIVSGSFFRKFLNEYKAYDARQKEIIDNQRNEIHTLTATIKEYKYKSPEAKKIKNQNKEIIKLNKKITQLKEEIKELKKQLDNSSK